MMGHPARGCAGVHRDRRDQTRRIRGGEADGRAHETSDERRSAADSSGGGVQMSGSAGGAARAGPAPASTTASLSACLSEQRLGVAGELSWQADECVGTATAAAAAESSEHTSSHAASTEEPTDTAAASTAAVRRRRGIERVNGPSRRGIPRRTVLLRFRSRNRRYGCGSLNRTFSVGAKRLRRGRARERLHAEDVILPRKTGWQTVAANNSNFALAA